MGERDFRMIVMNGWEILFWERYIHLVVRLYMMMIINGELSFEDVADDLISHTYFDVSFTKTRS